MSKAVICFNFSIKDAEELLGLFDDGNATLNGKNLEVLKRSGMVMALAAWETYVKDRFKEEISVMLSSVGGSLLGNFVQNSVNEDLKRFYNPNSAKTKFLFKKYFEVDITVGWQWGNYQPNQAKKKLDELISKRGDAAHRARNLTDVSHTIKREELEKSIRFLKGLVDATEKVSIMP